jgi:hypothetical protein
MYEESIVHVEFEEVTTNLYIVVAEGLTVGLAEVEVQVELFAVHE